MKQTRLCDFISKITKDEMILDSNDVFAELRKAQKVSDMVNNRSKEGHRPITEDDLRLLQHHLNRQKKKLSLFGSLMRKVQADKPDFKFYLSSLK